MQDFYQTITNSPSPWYKEVISHCTLIEMGCNGDESRCYRQQLLDHVSKHRFLLIQWGCLSKPPILTSASSLFVGSKAPAALEKGSVSQQLLYCALKL